MDISKFSKPIMHRIGGFNHFPTPEGTVGTVLERAIGGRHVEGRYGVQMDEFKDLVDDEDYFDGSDSKGPDPPIADFLKGHVPYCTIPLDVDDSNELYTQRPNRIRRNNKKERNYECEVDVEQETEIEDRSERNARVDAVRGNNKEFTVNYAAYNIFRPGYTCIFYGPRRSGKSVLVRATSGHMRHYFNEVVCFTMTKASGEYFQWLPYCRVVEGLDEDILSDLIQHQIKQKERRSRGEDVGNMNLLIIIDDCMAQGLRYVKTFNQLFYNGRHLDITLFVCVQDVRGIAPSATINADLVCTFSLPDRRGRDTIREKFADYLTRDEFDRLYDSPQINKKHHIVIFDIAHRYNDINKRILFGCVDVDALEPFVMGSREMWCESAESRQQLEDLGFGYLLNLSDWGIVKPKHVSKEHDEKRMRNTKSARNRAPQPSDMPNGTDKIPNPEKDYVGGKGKNKYF